MRASSKIQIFLVVLLVMISGGCAQRLDKTAVNKPAPLLSAPKPSFLPPLKPDWVGEKSRKYPSEHYLSAVGFGSTRKAAEDSAYTAIARIFQAEIKSKTREWEQYAQTEIRGKVQVVRDIHIEQLTSVATRKVLEDITIAEIWVDEPKELTYALAVMNRAHAAVSLKDRIAEMDQDVEELRTKALETPDKIETIRYLRRAMKILLNRDVYNTDLRIVNPVGKGIEPPVSLASIRQEIQTTLSNDIHIGVDLFGPYSANIRSAIFEALTKEGFSVEESSEPDRMDILIKGRVNFNKANLPQWKFVKWDITVDLINSKNGKIFGSLTRKGREGHLNFSEAETKAVTALQKEIVNKLSTLMVAFIYGNEQDNSAAY